MKNYLIKYSFDENAFDIYNDIYNNDKCEWREGILPLEEMIGKSVTWQITRQGSPMITWISFTLKSANELLEEIPYLIKQNHSRIRALVLRNNWLTEDQILLLDCTDMFL
jgi:hypothetical protein